MKQPPSILIAFTAALVIGCGSDKSSGPDTGSGGAPGVGGAISGTGAVGTGGAPVIDSSGGAPAVCKNVGEACNSPVDCCEGNTCNNTSPSADLSGCRPRCTKDADCQSGCCALFAGSDRGVCAADAKWCACGVVGNACSPTLPACCQDHVCLGKGPNTPDFECKKKCTQNSDCATNCCVAIPMLNQSACLDPVYCPSP